MIDRDIYLSQQPEDILRVMKEEDCRECFDCPVASIIRAKISYMSDVQIALAIDVEEINLELNQYINERIATEKEELRAITQSCKGMEQGEDASFWKRPSTMCQSQEYYYPPIEQVAGRITFWTRR